MPLTRWMRGEGHSTYAGAALTRAQYLLGHSATADSAAVLVDGAGPLLARALADRVGER